MTDVSGVSAWVQKAVAQIAAFDGNTRKIDTQGEKKILGDLLNGSTNLKDPDGNPIEGGLTNEDVEYIQGFMQDKNASRVTGKKPELNRDRMVELPAFGLNGDGKSASILKANSFHIYYYENGEPKITKLLDENGNVISNQDVKVLEDGKYEITQTSKNLDGTTIEIKFVMNKGDKNVIPSSIIIRSTEGTILHEEYN